jgi:D-mannonate dehydratase
MWNIACIKNEVEIDEKIAKALLKCGADVCYSWNAETDPLAYNVGFKDEDGKYRLFFNADHFEHMDFVYEKQVLDVLRENKVKGDICFGSLEGDNQGRFWGYRFDGQGGMLKLTGSLSFEAQSNTNER